MTVYRHVADAFWAAARAIDARADPKQVAATCAEVARDYMEMSTWRPDTAAPIEKLHELAEDARLAKCAAEQRRKMAEDQRGE